tara:strand:- start:663 stop:1103 length:441 start_codon:yes stop_codon:yes gene_type:complete
MPPPRETSNIYIGWNFPHTQFGDVTIGKKVQSEYVLICNQPPENQEFWKDTHIKVNTQWVYDQIDVHYYLQHDLQHDEKEEAIAFWTLFWKRYFEQYPFLKKYSSQYGETWTVDTTLFELGKLLPELKNISKESIAYTLLLQALNK